jgi:glycosyltransferase involved in cell wall biosynthesis
LILIDATPLQSEHRYRGVGTYTRHLTEGLAALAPDSVRFAATRHDLDALPASVLARAVTAPRGHRPAQLYWLYNEVYLRWIIRQTRPTVFHATDFNGLVRVRGVKTIATLYDCTSLRAGFHGRSVSERLSDVRWWVYYRHKLVHADHIVSISEHAKQDAVELLDIPAERITAIPLGVDLRHFRPSRGTGPFNGEKPYFLFVGGRAANKNLARVVRAFARVAPSLPDLMLFIAGPWRPIDHAWLREVSGGSEGWHRTRHLGFVSDAALPSLYGNAVAFVFPSLEEGFGLPVLEAMACGAPVITSNCSVLPEVAGDAALLVEPSSESDLASAMHELATSSGVREALIRRGYDRVQHFRWEDVAQQTLAVYRRVEEQS